jgi:energy-coupling factor transporter ATP-binding protein EcfA2
MTTREDVVLDVDGLHMRYGAGDVLHDVTFQARHGEVLVLLGPNGAGKTTTIEILEGFRMRSAGRVEVLGTDPALGDEHWRTPTWPWSARPKPARAKPRRASWRRRADEPDRDGAARGLHPRPDRTAPVLHRCRVGRPPIVLRRMARRESGSSVAERREKALQRVG